MMREVVWVCWSSVCARSCVRGSETPLELQCVMCVCVHVCVCVRGTCQWVAPCDVDAPELDSRRVSRVE
jgi:hypothetical protein